jgi:hypothetical protein
MAKTRHLSSEPSLISPAQANDEDVHEAVGKLHETLEEEELIYYE